MSENNEELSPLVLTALAASVQETDPTRALEVFSDLIDREKEARRTVGIGIQRVDDDAQTATPTRNTSSHEERPHNRANERHKNATRHGREPKDD